VTPAPIVEIAGLKKQIGGPRPLHIAEFRVEASDRIVLAGLDAAQAEMFVHLVTGAALPDEGDVRVYGRSTRDIATDTEWLASLDRFGLVSDRAVLFEAMPAAASLGLPITIAIDPMPPDVRARVDALGADVGLDADRLDMPASSLTPAERLRLHLARAAAHGPRLLLLEEPTSRLQADAERRAFGETLRRLSDRRGLGWLAVTNDDVFARASGGERLTLRAASGAVEAARRGLWAWTRS
jgi:branched-chain amino acid transport system ATP-binding protein